MLGCQTWVLDHTLHSCQLRGVARAVPGLRQFNSTKMPARSIHSNEPYTKHAVLAHASKRGYTPRRQCGSPAQKNCPEPQNRLNFKSMQMLLNGIEVSSTFQTIALNLCIDSPLRTKSATTIGKKRTLYQGKSNQATFRACTLQQLPSDPIEVHSYTASNLRIISRQLQVQTRMPWGQPNLYLQLFN
ncbi:hypothetical protein DUNSADRAFT_14515 [Dunaliella salina]|uniref:Encoded protein n=1 Tax=Dunaliella salina TaxID=3046 RepID=A0ABQ7G799_DUNSA|nr:hypothetical protein DUNSADRAFT_14515 [Dunaliella salina]|eukprot:KAF5830489.1 hypothetical protein DUNSADRAFT_14515 [Dunaliella salina]